MGVEDDEREQPTPPPVKDDAERAPVGEPEDGKPLVEVVARPDGRAGQQDPPPRPAPLFEPVHKVAEHDDLRQ